MNAPLLASRGTPACEFTNPLTIACPNCFNGIATTNDPGSARACPVCGGDGVLALRCNHCDQAEAIEFVQSDPLCCGCAVVAKENVFVMGEDL